MSGEKTTDKLQDAVSETKGVAENFVSTLGLTDLIIGGLNLYWAKLQYGSLAPTLFTSTGHEWVDIGLLACGAAFVGKIITLSSDTFAAVVLMLIEGLKLKVYSRFMDALNIYRGALGHESEIVGDPVDLAVAYATKAGPQYKLGLDSIQLNSTLAYSAFLTAFLYVYYITSKTLNTDLPAAIIIALVILVMMFLVIGITYQFNELNYLRNVFLTLQKISMHTSQEAPQAKSRQLREVKRMEILIKAPEPLKARHAAQVLAAIAIMRDALSMSEGSANSLRAQLNQITCGDLNAAIQVEAMGNRLLDSQKEYLINDNIQDLIAQAMLKRPSQSNELELLSLDEGSMRGTIREIIEDVRNWLFAILPQTNNLLPDENGQQFRNSVADIIKEKPLPADVRPIVAGTLMVGANQLRHALTDMKATGITVLP